MDYNAPRGSDLGDGVGWIWRTAHTSKKFLTMPLYVHLSLATGERNSDNPRRGEGRGKLPQGEGANYPDAISSLDYSLL